MLRAAALPWLALLWIALQSADAQAGALAPVAAGASAPARPPAIQLAATAAAARAAPPAERTERKLALVVGNARYRQIPLANATNDARLIATRLRELGFEVREHLDQGMRDFRRVVREFADDARQASGVVLFYYAGHGVQIEGRNYLLPVDIDLRDENEVRDDSVEIDDLLVSRLENVPAQTRIVILDACRDNPFAARSRSGRGVGGLAEMAARGTLIAYSSAPGATAEDGPDNGNSVYTRNLANEITTVGIEVELMLKRVRVTVVRETNGRQVPWVNTSLTTNFAFRPGSDLASEDAERKAQIARLEDELQQTRRQLELARVPGTGQVATAATASASSSAPAGRETQPIVLAARSPAEPAPVAAPGAPPSGAPSAIAPSPAPATSFEQLQESIRVTEATLQAAAQALSQECGRPVRYVAADITKKGLFVKVG